MAFFFSSQNKLLQQRARSVPYKKPLIVALLWTLLFYTFFMATILAMIIFIFVGTKPAAHLFAFTSVLALFLWFVSFLKRRRAHCALCQGTPFLDTGAHIHLEARKIPLLNHGHSNVISAVFTLQYRCMYCGTPYDFLKKSGNKSNHTG